MPAWSILRNIRSVSIGGCAAVEGNVVFQNLGAATSLPWAGLASVCFEDDVCLFGQVPLESEVGVDFVAG